MIKDCRPVRIFEVCCYIPPLINKSLKLYHISMHKRQVSRIVLVTKNIYIFQVLVLHYIWYLWLIFFHSPFLLVWHKVHHSRFYTSLPPTLKELSILYVLVCRLVESYHYYEFYLIREFLFREHVFGEISLNIFLGFSQLIEVLTSPAENQ